jgi:hypothetical protein
VLSNVGGERSFAIAAISWRCSRIAASNAGAKCLVSMRSNGGRP